MQVTRTSRLLNGERTLNVERPTSNPGEGILKRQDAPKR